MTASCHCGARWTGTRLEHCTVCHRTFTGTTAGDKHQTGDFNVRSGPDRRRCRTDDELLAAGLAPRTLTSGLVVWGRKGGNPFV